MYVGIKEWNKLIKEWFKLNLRKCNKLWWEDPSKFTIEELELLKYALFEKGMRPLGDQYGEYSPLWVEWKGKVELEINNRLK